MVYFVIFHLLLFRFVLFFDLVPWLCSMLCLVMFLCSKKMTNSTLSKPKSCICSVLISTYMSYIPTNQHNR
ncbi:hypothetical protein CIPAW_08G155900 [Carya illinoinensis]|uniref:Uncharacterized protein n=1 Tax=Carya illinoinensis TaxID=32201 RepID=A0A8T1Q055_CARIL|nr:hypothetical protein CIPAW_08G155900 [Carya illinoinensis]